MRTKLHNLGLFLKDETAAETSCFLYDRKRELSQNIVDSTENSFSHNCKCLGGSRGGGVVIAPASRSNKRGLKPEKWQDSWWASCSQGFESLPRRHQHTLGQIPGYRLFGLSEDFVLIIVTNKLKTTFQ